MIFPILLTIRTEDPAVMALRALPELHARVTYLSTREKRLESTEIDVDSSRGGVAARLVKRPEHGNDRQDVRYWATGNNLRAYDAVNEEWLSRPLRGGGSPIAKLWASVGLGDDPVQTSFDAESLAQFLGRMRDKKFGKVQSTPGRLTLIGKLATVVAVFEAKSSLLTSVDIRTKDSHTSWKIEYGRSRLVSTGVPASAIRVDSFVIGKELSSFDSPATEDLARRMLRAYKRMDRTEVTLDSGRRIYLGKASLGEATEKGRWMYHGGVLTTRLPALKTTPCRRSDVLDRLAEDGWTVDPLVREQFARAIPFSSALVAGFDAKIAGEMKMAGADMALLRLTGPGRRITLAIRKSDGLVLSQSAQILDRAGNILSSSETRYRYRTALSPTQF